MHLTPEICYRALRTRDPRFDGRFFVAVRTTGVYCRPICPARTPRRENCSFVPCAAAAEEAGYRPCRRCRPESAPGTPAWLGTSATVSRGLRLIADGALDENGVGDLAARLGLGERQLRRLFTRHLGAAPLAIARTRRVHFAAELLAQTDWPVSRVALASGFTSLRRFNEAIRDTFHRAPRELRAASRSTAAAAEIHLPYRAPLDTESLFAYLAARAVPGVERVANGAVRRALRIAGRPLVVEVSAPAREPALAVRASGAEAEHWLALAERVRGVFDLRADPAEIGRQLGADPLLRARLRRHPGVRVPGAWDPFEIAVRIVLGQQVTVAGATRLAGRLAERFGERVTGAPDDPLAPVLLFPEPDALADAPLEQIGLTRQRAGALRALAAAVARNQLALVPGADPAAAREALLALPGIGPWTAELVLLRALGEPDAFPAGDLGLCRALGCDARALERRAERWRPWRGYAAMLLWTAPGPRSAGARKVPLSRPSSSAAARAARSTPARGRS